MYKQISYFPVGLKKMPYENHYALYYYTDCRGLAHEQY